MSSSSSNPKSSSSKNEYTNDVFLLTFRSKCISIDSLRTSFRDAAMKTFIDDDKLSTFKLLQVIKRSRIAVIAFTEEFGKYAESVRKVEQIMKCKNDDSMVFGVFCGVNRRQVRDQWGISMGNEKYGRWMTVKEKIMYQRRRWARVVVKAASSLFGWEVSTFSSSDSKEIREITNYIKRELDISYLNLPPSLVGIKLRMKEVFHLSNYYSKDTDLMEENVIIVGICGIEGIGKTTIVRPIYDIIKVNFERKSFLENINNVWAKDNGPVCLQEQLISDVSDADHEKIQDIEMGIRHIKTILHNKRSLVVLDDVSETDQLMALCGSREWFGFGSMILIITRNKHLLDHLNVKYVYEMKKMDTSESLELFSWNAFKQSNPTNDFANLAKSVITYCEGLPLVLEVIGSLLFNRTIPEWKMVLKKLKSIPTGQIKERLKVSYEYLDDSVKDVFYNIACFYVGEEKQCVMQKLSGFRFPIEVGISMLIERKLVKVDMNNKLSMHDLLQEIAKGSINPYKSKPTYVYNVFLSFRGEDTRKSFTAHLYAALKKAGVEVFMDHGIQKGENISSSLIQAIESSKMSIIVFSTNYAGSRWCLQELEKIMECHRITGQEVLPIFYDVQPSDVRKQTGAFGKAFDILTTRNSAGRVKKLSWTRALNEAANLSGWNSHAYRTEVELIDHVVETVTMKIDDNTNLFVAQHPVGMKARVQDIVQLLSGKSNEIIIVGIFGMGGIGKTTIAKAIYNEIGRSFEAKFFLTNIREVWEQENGHVYLQEQLLSGILDTRRMTLHSAEWGKAILKERLKCKRSLVVLDDINSVDQLNALCGSREWFGSGSRIIITTRDEHLLKILKVDKVYNMKEMDDTESLELFSWHAFKQAFPIEDFVELSRKVVAYSEGLPLALEILGSYLFDRAVQAWESVLEKLEGIPNDQIHKKLKIGYDGLSDDMEKDIFLDICCFFIGKDRNYVTQILDGCGRHANIGITRLIERSLVKVDKNNKLDMHGLLRDMGRAIIREKSPEEPEKHTRLWFYNDVVNVLRDQMGTIAVKGLSLNLPTDNTLCFNTIAFKMMKRLKLLQLDHVRLEGSFEYISKELRWLCWHGFPLNYMPDNFYQENVVAIDLKYSNLIEVWKKSQLLERLKILNLSHSYYLRQTPDFSKIPSLERLILKGCPRLSLVHPSIGDLKYLILVNLKDCKDLNHLPRSLYKLKSLKTLNLSGCSRIDKLEEDIEQMESLTTLLANETAITQVPFSLVRSRSIKYVSLCGHEGLPNDIFPPLIWSWMSPRNNSRSLVQAFASMPFLLQSLWHGFYNQRSAKLETRASASQLSCTKTPTLLGFHDHVDIARAENFTSSLTIQLGIFNNITATLLKNISQGWSEQGLDCSLPGNNYPHWLIFENEGSSVSFTVSQAVGCCLKGMILCIIYSSSEESMTFVYPVSVTIKNFTKTTIEFYKRDAETASDDKEWQNIMSNLEPGNEVEVIVAFAHKYSVKKTAIYLVYGEEIDKKYELNITGRIIE